MIEEEALPEMDFSDKKVLGLKESLDYLEDKCKYVGIRSRFNEYVDVPTNSDMYELYGIFWHSFGAVVEDETRLHDESVFINTFDINESGVFLTL